MRMTLMAWMAASCLLLSGIAAQAGTLTSATWIGTFQGVPISVAVNGTGTATGTTIGTVSLSIGPSFHSIFDGSGLTPVYVSQTLGGSQTLNSANVANQGVPGVTNFFLGTGPGGSLLFHVGLSVGVSGTFMTTATVGVLGGAPLTVSATFFPWTTGTAMFTGLTSTTYISSFHPTIFYIQNAPLPDATFSGTNNLVNGVGSITLVSPTRTYVCVGSAADAGGPCTQNNGGNNTQVNTTAAASSLTLNFAVPEPGTILLLGAGLVGLAARMRKP